MDVPMAGKLVAQMTKSKASTLVVLMVLMSVFQMVDATAMKTETRMAFLKEQ